MKYLSLFSGIGGFELGIQQAYENYNSHKRGKAERERWVLEEKYGISSNGDSSMLNSPSRRASRREHTCVGYSEIDKYAIQIYQKHFPEHKNFGDITKINEKELPDFELLCGGFPCQSFSIAGKRGGFKDTRGTLFFDICRILAEKRPRLLLLENVKGLLSHDEGRTFATIIASLDELGYDVQWQVLNSKNFGVPQNRERVLIVGHLRGTPRPQVFPFGDDTETALELQGQHSNTLTTRYYGGQANGTYVLESELDAQEIHQLNRPTHSNDRVYSVVGVSPTLNTMQGGNRQPFISQRPRGKNVGGNHKISPTLSSHSFQDNNHLVEDMQIRRLTPIECERLQGFPENWTKWGREHSAEKEKAITILKGSHIVAPLVISDSQRYKCCGNAVTTNVIQAVVERML